LDAGRLLYEALELSRRPGWAVAVLDECCNRLDPIPAEVEAVRALARDPARWREAHNAFDRVRLLVLEAERTHPGVYRYRESVLFLAENVAKVTYNASGGSAPFDHDAGWWIASCARTCVDRIGSSEFERRVWAALARIE
jgi:hypothetical protein